MRTLVGTVLAPLLLLTVADAQQLTLPRPTGPYAAGRRSLDIAQAAANGNALAVDLLYPAKAGTGILGAYYLTLDAELKHPESKADVTEELGDSASLTCSGNVHASIRENADVDRTGSPYPLLLFSPGLGNSPFLYTAQLQELTSHGFIVATVRSGTGAVDEIARARDLVFVLNQLISRSRDKDSWLAGWIDFSRIGAFGHSLGGRAAAAACQLDGRILACLNEDGQADPGHQNRPYSPLADTKFTGAFAMLDWFDPGLSEHDLAAMHTTLAEYARHRLAATGAALACYSAPALGGYHFTLLQSGMQHTAFTDLPWLTADSAAKRDRYGSYLETINQVVLKFFDRTLNRSPAFACDSVRNDILVRCYGKGLNPENKP